MTAKEFFKSNVFKCLITLLCVLLVSGIFLTVMHGLLEVTDEERFNRAISKIYGRPVEVTAVEYNPEEVATKNYSILEAYKDNDGNYLVKSKGTGGFGGTITCWVLVIVENNEVKTVEKVVIETSDGETLLSNINFLDKYQDVVYTDGYQYSTDNGYTVSGATMSSNAINNCVNGAIAFVRQSALGVAAPDDPYKDYLFHDFIDMEKTSWTKNGKEITYNVTTTKNAPAGAFKFEIVVDETKTVKSITVVEAGSVANSYQGVSKEEYDEKANTNAQLCVGKDLSYFVGLFGENMEYPGDNAGTVISTGATRSSYLSFYASAFAVANYDYILNLKLYTEYIDLDNTSATVENGKVNFTIATIKNAPAGAFKLNIVVNGDGKIEEITVTEAGSVANSYQGVSKEEYDEKANTNAQICVGKDLSYFVGLFGENMEYPGDNADTAISTGATRSSFLCYYAAAFATANYSDYLSMSDGGENDEQV